MATSSEINRGDSKMSIDVHQLVENQLIGMADPEEQLGSLVEILKLSDQDIKNRMDLAQQIQVLECDLSRAYLYYWSISISPKLQTLHTR